jgi:ComF family protein
MPSIARCMKWLIDILDDFSGLLYPRVCYGCGNHLMRNEDIICTECLIEIPRTNYHLEQENPVSRLFWGRCVIGKAAAFSYYNKGSRIRTLIHNLKYKGVREIGTVLGSMYGHILKDAGFTEGIDIVVPVPLHPSRERSRGFNQSLIIAGSLASAAGLPLENGVLARVSKSQTQTKRSRYERWANVEGIFSVTDPLKIADKHILLVDDVITTGSTLEACVNELVPVDGVKVSVTALACAVL